MRRKRGWMLTVWLLGLWGLSAAQSSGPGYALRRDRVEVNRRAQWQEWSYPGDVVTITPSGKVSPRYLKSTFNAALDASKYTYTIKSRLRDQYANSYMDGRTLMVRGGVKRAGCRLATASNAIDGRVNTYWEPDPDRPVDDWWLEIDLGRVVSASRIVVRFAEGTPDAPADPFLQFRVHTATGLSPFGQQDESGALDYVLAGSTHKPNLDQRTFEFELDPVGKHSEGLEGRMVQYVRIAATASRLERAEQITQEQYAALDEADQGAVDYIWRIAGEERRVSVQRYAELPESERGGVRYFRRERPKLAEVEVWTVGDNVSLGIQQRGGSLTDINPNSFPERAFDGNMRTDWFELVYRTTGETAEWGLLTVDLGAQFWVDAVRILSRPPKVGGGENLLLGYLLRGSDGTRAADGTLVWTQLSPDSRQLNSDTRLFEDRFPAKRLRYFELRNLDISRRTRAYLGDRVQSVVTEIQVYAVGYPPSVKLASDIIELGRPRNLTTVEWDADTPPGTRVEIRTRTGDKLRKVYHYFKSDGNEVSTREEYDKLPSFFRGDIVTEVLPGDGWSNWSQPYEYSGQGVRSPSPRQYLMINATLESTEQESAPSLSAIRVRFTDPVAQSVTGEIEPKKNVVAGPVTDFDIYLRPEYAAGDPGLDRIRVASPSATPVVLQAAVMGSEAEIAAGDGTVFRPRGEGIFVDGAGDTLRVESAGAGSLQVLLPHVMGRADPSLLKLSLQARVFRSGSTFAVAVGNTRYPGIWQHVDGGDVVGDALARGAGLTVMTPTTHTRLRDVQIVPRMVTPNGDGINDVMTCRFSVLQINASREVSVGLYDLAGRKIRKLAEQRPSASGLYEITWDGRGDDGQLVPPGLYVVRVRVDSDDGDEHVARWVVGVAY